MDKKIKISMYKVFVVFLISFFVLYLNIACSRVENEVYSNKSKISITNISYDPTREFYETYNQLFQQYWEQKNNQYVEIVQSHGGSGKQARSVLEGNEADVVTLALESDVNELAKAGMISQNWIEQFPEKSAPYTSTIVFLVRAGNPKNILDWDDLIRPDIEIITPNPKNSGGARWNFLAAWAFADKTFGENDEKSKAFIQALYQNVSVLDTGARGSTITFVENEQGDVLLAWENEAFLSMNKYPNDFEIITPSLSILAQPTVAIVDENVDLHETREVSNAYLEYLYSDEAQQLIAENYYRPINQTILKKFQNVFDLNVQLVTIDHDFGGWGEANKKFFADGAVFDEVYDAIYSER